MKRVYHTWDKWECYPAGLYENGAEGLKATEATQRYAAFLRDEALFSGALARVLTEWPNSCEHYLSNENMNRLAWLGQASACLELGLPACFRGGFNLLTAEDRSAANTTALVALNRWLVSHGEAELDVDGAKAKTMVELY